MPLKVFINGEVKNLQPTTTWKTEKLVSSNANLKVDVNYYVTSKKLE